MLFQFDLIVEKMLLYFHYENQFLKDLFHMTKTTSFISF